MRQAIVGLAALLAGCAAAGPSIGVETPENAGIVQAHVRQQDAAEETLNVRDMQTVMGITFCGNSEPVVTMDEHGYTLECGQYTFVHYQHPDIFDADGKLALEAACEETLFMRTELRLFYMPELKTTIRWIDSGCDGEMDFYGAWQQFGNEPAYSIDEFQSAAMDECRSTEEQMKGAYRNLLEKLNVRQVQQAWEALYSRL